MINETAKLTNQFGNPRLPSFLRSEEEVGFSSRAIFKTLTIGLVLVTIIYFLSLKESLSGFFVWDVYYYSWVVELIALIYFAWQVSKLRMSSSGKIGFLAGFILGLIVAIFRLIWYHKLWTIFNLVTEPIIIALIGWLSSAMAGLIKKFWQIESDNSSLN